MPVVKTLVRRKPYAKKGQVPDAVKKYVRKAITAAPELKKYFFGTAQSYLCDVPYTYNMPYQSGVSTGPDPEGDLIGAKMRIKRILIRGQLTNYQSTTPSDSTNARIMIIKSDKFVTVSSLAYTEMFIGGGSVAPVGIPDNNQITVLADKMVHLQTSITAANNAVPFEIDVPCNFIQEFSDITSNYAGKNTNLYLVFCVSNVVGTSGISTAGGITSRTCVWFTDA